MFDNIGKKIKAFAKAVFFIEAILFLIVGLVLLDSIKVWWSALIVIVGLLMAYISSWFVYGFGEIIDKLSQIEKHTREGRSQVNILNTASGTKNESEERAGKEDEAKVRRETEEKIRREVEERIRREAEEKARREAEEKARREAEDRARREAEDRARREAEEKARREAEDRARREAEEKARREAERSENNEEAECLVYDALLDTILDTKCESTED